MNEKSENQLDASQASSLSFHDEGCEDDDAINPLHGVFGDAANDVCFDSEPTFEIRSLSNLAVHFRGRLVDINIGDVNSLLSTACVKINDAERGEDVPRLALLHQLLRLVNGPDDPAEVSRLVKAGFQSVVHLPSPLLKSTRSR